MDALNWLYLLVADHTVSWLPAEWVRPATWAFLLVCSLVLLLVLVRLLAFRGQRRQRERRLQEIRKKYPTAERPQVQASGVRPQLRHKPSRRSGLALFMSLLLVILGLLPQAAT